MPEKINAISEWRERECNGKAHKKGKPCPICGDSGIQTVLVTKHGEHAESVNTPVDALNAWLNWLRRPGIVSSAPQEQKE